MSKYALTRADLEVHLAGTRRRLRRACAAFDDGDAYAVTEIATVIRVLLHDGSNKSLMGQLGLKNRPFHDCIPDFGEASGEHMVMPGLASFALYESGPRIVPMAEVSGPQRRLPFAKWWETKVYHVDNTHLSRSDLVRMVAGKTGAHIDPKIDLDHHVMATGVGSSYHTQGAEDLAPIPDMEKACIRSIAAELEWTLEATSGPIPPAEPL